MGRSLGCGWWRNSKAPRKGADLIKVGRLRHGSEEESGGKRLPVESSGEGQQPKKAEDHL